jgi:hypothetical protein
MDFAASATQRSRIGMIDTPSRECCSRLTVSRRSGDVAPSGTATQRRGYNAFRSRHGFYN